MTATIHPLPVIPRPATRPQSNRDAIRSWFASYGATAAQVASLLPPVTTPEQAAYLTELAQRS